MHGFQGNLARSLDKDATLSDALQMLDKHYGIVMKFNGLSKELFFLKQVLCENVAEFGVWLSQQVQILQSEYPGRIQLEHVEGVKCDCFYEGPDPEYQQILAHRVDGEHPVNYSDLLLATWKLERLAEAQDFLPPKMATTSGPNETHSLIPGNLFTLHKLKGNHTVTAWAVTVGNEEVEADSGAKQEGEGETEPSADEKVEASGRAGGTDQPMEYIVPLAKAVQLYQ